jgi:hypothetical protein
LRGTSDVKLVNTGLIDSSTIPGTPAFLGK